MADGDAAITRSAKNGVVGDETAILKSMNLQSGQLDLHRTSATAVRHLSVGCSSVKCWSMPETTLYQGQPWTVSMLLPIHFARRYVCGRDAPCMLRTQSPDPDRKGLERHHLAQDSAPALADGRVFAAPSARLEGRERRLALIAPTAW